MFLNSAILVLYKRHSYMLFLENGQQHSEILFVLKILFCVCVVLITN